MYIYTHTHIYIFYLVRIHFPPPVQLCYLWDLSFLSRNGDCILIIETM